MNNRRQANPPVRRPPAAQAEGSIASFTSESPVSANLSRKSLLRQLTALAHLFEIAYFSRMDVHADLIDPFLRRITYLRVSVTDRCDFRCVYCMSENMTFLPKKEILTLEELDKACTAFINLGIRKIRITGGEPLVRRGIMSFFESISRHLETAV